MSIETCAAARVDSPTAARGWPSQRQQLLRGAWRRRRGVDCPCCLGLTSHVWPRGNTWLYLELTCSRCSGTGREEH